MAKKTMPVKTCLGELSPITKCEGIKAIDNFYTSWSNFVKKESKVPYCKDCCTKMVDYYIKNGTTMKSAIYYVCQKIDVPFILEIYEKAYKEIRNSKTVTNYFGIYMKNLRLRKNMQEVWTDFSATDVNISDIDTRIEERELKQKELEKFVLDWGDNRPYKDYQFLEIMFDKLCEDMEITSIHQEGLYRDLCYVELLIRNKKVRNEDIKSETDLKMKLQSRLGFDKVQIEQKSDEERTFEASIKRIEETKPCESEYKEKYKDILDIKSSWGQHVIRAIKNMLVGMKEYPNVTRDTDE